MYTLEQLEGITDLQNFIKKEKSKKQLNENIQKEKSELLDFISEIDFYFDDIIKNNLEVFLKLKTKKEKLLKVIEFIFIEYEKKQKGIEKEQIT